MKPEKAQKPAANRYWRDLTSFESVRLVGSPGTRSYVASDPDSGLPDAVVFWHGHEAAAAQAELDRLVLRTERFRRRARHS